MNECRLPWAKFYYSDWRSDPSLRLCSIGARGFWMEMLSIMHEADPLGSLVNNGKQITTRQLASLSGCSAGEAEEFIRELEEAGVFSRDPDGTIFSRRMRRDDKKMATDRANGKGGGNPSLAKGVNPPVNPADKGEDKAQMPEARGYIPEADLAPPNLTNDPKPESVSVSKKTDAIAPKVENIEFQLNGNCYGHLDGKPEAKSKGPQPYPDEFELLWDTIERNPNASKSEAFREWKRLGARDKFDALDGAMAFNRWLESERIKRPRDPPPILHLNRFIKQRRWESLLESTT